jgi:long-chain acyl-CoA synthetase
MTQTDCTIFTLFEDAVRANGDIAAIVRHSQTISYTRFYERVVCRAGQILEQSGPFGGVAIINRDAVEILEWFFACAAIGRPALPLDPNSPPAFIAGILDRFCFSAVSAGRELPEDLAGSIAILRNGLPATSHFEPLNHRFQSNDEFYWGLTSGTTGEPKIFVRAHGSWIASFEAAEAVFSFAPNSKILIPGPLYHSLFLYGAVHALCRGHSLILPESEFRPNRLGRALGQATHFYAVPFMLGDIANACPEAPKLETIFSGGAKLSDDIRLACETCWPKSNLIEFYGTSETSFISFHSTQRPAIENSVGWPFPNVSVEIRDSDGQTLPDAQAGEIFVSSPMVFSRYLGEKPAGKSISVGDMGFIGPDGCLHLTGRTSRVIKSRGLKIHPEAIESALLELPDVRRAAVVGLPDPRRGEVAVAAIEFAGGDHLARKALSAHCRERLGAKLSPQRFFVIDGMPLTANGKTAIAVVREDLLSGHGSFRELT